MMSNTSFRNHVNAPHNQPFNVGAKANRTKKNSWWNIHSSNYWRSREKNKNKKQEQE